MTQPTDCCKLNTGPQVCPPLNPRPVPDVCLAHCSDTCVRSFSRPPFHTLVPGDPVQGVLQCLLLPTLRFRPSNLGPLPAPSACDRFYLPTSGFLILLPSCPVCEHEVSRTLALCIASRSSWPFHLQQFPTQNSMFWSWGLVGGFS